MFALTGFHEVREQVLQRAPTAAAATYFEVEGRPGSPPDLHPPTESGQGSLEPVYTAEVSVKTTVIPMALLIPCS
jgi:hypothetical protein